ncbi:5-oxoprolinase subunit B family protein [Lapillicoccus jejuensis]|uniref:KipI family sensor histidine kinase inhibitor n=1 Tax=Lapillicoccus jejuensis TaxID=402171 RepID=A0A542DWJ1_9MICO|nr:allophanate hydrolase subunit 1 [Lapillicoccus jejuensis]TQJ07450.1 KipI family sensor histidine kinase inhibitor [Lapillicoccus jejuensis]
MTGDVVALRRCGEDAVLVELADGRARRRWEAAVRAAALPGLAEVVPGAVTVLVRADRPAALSALVDAVRRLRPTDAPEPPAADVLTVPVRYDGPDLADVARVLRGDVADVVRRHTGQEWEVEFCGFAPGFGYLVPVDGARARVWTSDPVPRRPTPRTRVPAGAVALAGPWSAVYPGASAGGWQLVGTTDLAVWDPDRDPPALLVPGRRVRFEAVR